MSTVNTKFDIGQDAYIVENNAISKKKVSEIDTTDNSSAETITNKTTDSLGNEGSYSDSQLFDTPQAAADALVAAYNVSLGSSNDALPATEANAGTGDLAPAGE